MSTDKRELPKNLILRDGVYYVRAKINGRPIWKTTGYGEGAIKSAIAKRDEIMVKLRNKADEPEKVEVPSFNSWADTYVKVYSAQKLAPWRDDQILAPVRKQWGRSLLTAITPSKAQSYLQDRLRTCAPSTVNRERGTLQAIFQRAIEEGILEKNPFAYIERQQEGPRIRVLTAENEAKLRSVLTPLYQRWLTFMLGTGLRLAEAQAITKVEVDPVRELIAVPSEAAKFRKAREVPLRPDVWQVIQEQLDATGGKLWHANQQNYRQVLGGKGVKANKGYVAGACERAGVPHFSPHDLRHTFATRYLQAGGDIYKLSKILGHASVNMTERNYAHLESRDLVEASRSVWKSQGVA